MIHKGLFILGVLLLLTACGQDEIEKQEQVISFDNLPAQISMAEESLKLTASASSGLFVTFTSSDSTIAVVERKQAVFRQPGKVTVTASQAGNSQFYEATNVSHTFEILSVNPAKKEQIIHFELPSAWKSSQGGLALTATATSGLPVTYTSGDKTVGFISGGYLVLEHYYEDRGEKAYTRQISITASQAGNEEYNPAANVVKLITAAIDVAH
ncbi:MAG: hypothetical protein LBH19_01495 [Dysgonamonadaceae bacterium]|jgi:hypothetical protein|nr:hypothetical protein [Dysgonamonadaceae bacterium]